MVAGAFPFAIHNSIVEGWVGLFGVCMLLMGIGLCGFWVDTVLRLQKADPFGDDSKKSNCKSEIQGFFAALRMTGNSKGNSNGSGNE